MAGAGNNLYSNIASGMQSAGQGLNNAMNYSPQQISNVPAVSTGTVTANNIDTPKLTDANMSEYMNPYTAAVYDQSLSQLDKARQMAMTQGSDQAQMAGAFGGSRHGVADAQTNKAFAEQAGQLASNLNNQNWQQAMQSAQFDTGNQFRGNMQNVANALQAGLANASNQLSSSGQNAANNLAMQQANQQAGLQGNQQAIGAGQAMGGLANLGFGMGQTLQNQQAMQGAQQQAMMQQLIDAGKNQFQGWANSPGQSLQYPLSALGVSPVPQTTTQSMQPGLFNYLTLMSMM